ncbi:CoA transferase [Candidatus Poriferisodalis sp.]|uniref:CoA transferase n=1 Tax=Candidatus Poriferisodalis sp. TaxID=3101277 RepID=UPI003B5992A4
MGSRLRQRARGQPIGRDAVDLPVRPERAACKLCGVRQPVGCDDLATLSVGDRLERRAELEAALAAWTSKLDEAEVERQCQDAGVAAHRVQNSPELAVDPQITHRRHWVEVPHSTHGSTIIEAPRFTMSRSRVWPEVAAPALGEHLYEVLTEHLGYDADRVAELAAAEAFD